MTKQYLTPQQLFDNSYLYKENDPDRCIELLETAKRLSEAEGKACFMIRCDNAICDALQYAKNRPWQAMKVAVAASIQVNRITCSEYLKKYTSRSVMNAYMHCDPVGYEDDIRDIINHMEDGLETNTDLWRQMPGARGGLALALDRFQDVINEGQISFHRCEGQSFRLADTHSLLCETYYQLDDIDKIFHHAIEGEAQTRRAYTTNRWLIEFKAWQAYCHLKNGETKQAQTAFLQCKMIRSRLRAIPYPAFYDAICAYHIVQGNYTEAMHLRDQQLQECIESESPYRITECRLRRCKLLKQMGKSFEDEKKAAQHDAVRLRKPDHFLAKLNAI